jgi:hypothetical protein
MKEAGDAAFFLVSSRRPLRRIFRQNSRVFPDTSVGGLTAYLVAQFLARNFVALAFETPFFITSVILSLIFLV